MERIILFRAWDTVNEKMYPVEDINFREMLISVNEGDNSITGLMEDFVLMQNTGLQDSKGMFIYEGDIVERGIITFSRGKFTGTYYGSNGDLQEDWEDDLYQERNITVIGNIYENKSLLNT